jgi:hypothetical protein
MCNPHQLLARSLLTMALLFSLKLMGQQSDAQKTAEQELLALHRADRRAHFNHDIQTLISHTAFPLLDIRDGRINRMTRDYMHERFSEYFRRAEFSSWDDVEPPVVHVSPDGKMAWIIFRVRVVYTETDASGTKSQQDSVAAWMSAYEKENGKWMMTAVTSTFAEK